MDGPTSRIPLKELSVYCEDGNNCGEAGMFDEIAVLKEEKLPQQGHNNPAKVQLRTFYEDHVSDLLREVADFLEDTGSDDNFKSISIHEAENMLHPWVAEVYLLEER